MFLNIFLKNLVYAKMIKLASKKKNVDLASGVFIAQYRIMRYSICFQTYLDGTNEACYEGVTHKTAAVTSLCHSLG